MPDEIDAVRRAVALLEDGDLALVLVDDVRSVLESLRTQGATP